MVAVGPARCAIRTFWVMLASSVASERSKRRAMRRSHATAPAWNASGAGKQLVGQRVADRLADLRALGYLLPGHHRQRIEIDHVLLDQDEDQILDHARHLEVRGVHARMLRAVAAVGHEGGDLGMVAGQELARLLILGRVERYDDAVFTT